MSLGQCGGASSETRETKWADATSETNHSGTRMFKYTDSQQGSGQRPLARYLHDRRNAIT